MSATDVAFAMAGAIQAVLAVIWLIGAWLVRDERRAAIDWAGYAAFSAVSFALLTTALHVSASMSAELVRAAGNLAGVAALIALQRGIRQFVGRPMRVGAHGWAIAVVLIASFVGLSPSGGSFRVATISIVLALLALAMARDLMLEARDRLHLRWPVLLALPVLCAAGGFAFRGLRALLLPDSVALEMTRDSALNVGSALGYVVIALTFHATLMALVVGRLTAQLRHRSRHDGLTGLLNRRAIEEALHAQIRRSLRIGEPFSVLMFDLDHFKSINDRFGHAAGDRALKHVAMLLEAGLREVDGLGRIGGEEFLALMPNAALADVGPVAERLRERLAASPVVLDSISIPLSVSIGIAQWSDPAEDASRLLVRADAALYRAKGLGRDRVVAATTDARAWPKGSSPGLEVEPT